MATDPHGTPITLEQFWQIWERTGDGWDFDLSEPDENTIRIRLGGQLTLDAVVVEATVQSPELLAEPTTGEE